MFCSFKYARTNYLISFKSLPSRQEPAVVGSWTQRTTEQSIARNLTWFHEQISDFCGRIKLKKTKGRRTKRTRNWWHEVSRPTSDSWHPRETVTGPRCIWSRAWRSWCCAVANRSSGNRRSPCLRKCATSSVLWPFQRFLVMLFTTTNELWHHLGCALLKYIKASY